MKKWLCLQVLACLVIAVQPVQAQEVKERGHEAVSMGVSSDSATIGYWHKLTDDNSIGGDFTFSYRDTNHNENQAYQISPGIKHYVLPARAVSPYLYGAIRGRYQGGKSSTTNSSWRMESYAAGVQGGIGMEWFPIQDMSIAGHVGAIAQYERTHSVSGSGLFRSENNDEGFSIGTISSGILLNLYF